LLSLVIPVYNEAEVLPLLLARLLKVAPGWEMPYEVIFVDDGSTDDSVRVIRDLTRGQAAFRILQLSRNFGHQPAITAGLAAAKGEAVVVMDADLQDPPEMIETFLEKWREGYQVTYAVRRQRQEGLLKRWAYKRFYRLLKRISSLDIPLDSGDFCLMDRRVLDELQALPENIRFVRGLRSYVGFRQVGVPYAREARAAGRPKYSLRSLSNLALDGIFGFSLLPLRLASIMGLCIALPSFLLGMFFIIHRVFDFKLFGYSPTDTPGLASLATGMFFLGGVVLIILGIIGEYLGRIYVEVKRRPPYIVEREIQATEEVENPDLEGFT
jgi:polyisoprenyl-phosphate glycosyltransferase